MFSKRLEKLKAYKTETSSAKVKLSSNELPYDLPEELKDRIAEGIKRIPLSRYPDPNAEELKLVIADFFGVSERNIVLGNGSDELIYYLSTAVGELDQGILIPVPTFPMYEISADVFGRPKVTALLGDDFDIDLPTTFEKIRNQRVVLAYYSFPNNPTGNLFSREKIEKIRDEGVFTVVDEAYYHYSGETFLKDALSREDTVILRTLSKIGLAGLRVGILIGREEIVSEIDKIRLPFNITFPSQVIAKIVLTEGREFIENAIREVIKEREKLIKEMSNIEGVEVFPSRANFILFRTPFPADEIHRKLLQKGVLIRNMSYLPKLDGCLRVSIGKPEENEAFIEALHNIVRCGS